MEYSSDTFLDLYGVIYLAVNGTVSHNPPGSHPNIFNCVPKSNKAFMGLGWCIPFKIP